MIAKLEKEKNVLTAIYKRFLRHSPADVWAYLTDNNKLQQWFPELEIQALKNGGEIRFDFGDGNFERMEITEMIPQKVLAFTWDKNLVRFELATDNSGCMLVFKEYLHEITEHTAKDLAGWHVCLDVIEALLDGRSVGDRTAIWQTCYPTYQQLLQDAQS
ncbi:SRPBCC family protein [Virgibacillus sp. 179-BFC.A HS]|uniref:SRPBCC family protein n=1 Tax=Tigheibacillus jepli TaxID=3035914 RepID=A0ABU5CK94_9BACI|nr:SRPBCC family protein [Virgibacillus sp. 179-BFC.A HS]MDY0406774.1 SRPBCC family protein [Virgibacillus sp. 179-BFC.A HS]